MPCIVNVLNVVKYTKSVPYFFCSRFIESIFLSKNILRRIFSYTLLHLVHTTKSLKKALDFANEMTDLSRVWSCIYIWYWCWIFHLIRLLSCRYTGAVSFSIFSIDNRGIKASMRANYPIEWIGCELAEKEERIIQKQVTWVKLGPSLNIMRKVQRSPDKSRGSCKWQGLAELPRVSKYANELNFMWWGKSHYWVIFKWL